ncbi:MAG: flagellar motor protein [Okeania sp. SIO3B5]|uniref:hypothetical protein n=1 Tax=Okeania sp. SIO3B5 TaxID=2607811 RepID=UPI0013FF3C05|nr:hypothetical protein [Okeania sp. SIO3B5]NEO51962.1 flagellar motor protein [Okeania sp. SIO3B5]
MKKLWNFVSNEDDPFGPGVDLIVSLLAILLVMLVITAGAYQNINTKNQELASSLKSSRNRVEQLNNLLDAEKEKNSKLYKRLRAETAARIPQFPPNIVITAAQGYDFPSGSAELTDALNGYIRNTLVPNIEENIQKFDVDTVVIIGHTDGQPVAEPFSNLDGLVEEVATGNESVGKLKEGSNVDLGLMRALAVVRKLQDIQKSEGKLRSLDPLKGFRAYSAGPLILRNGEFAQPNENPDQERRRIEIRFTKSGEK